MKTERFLHLFFFIGLVAYQILFWKEQMGLNTLIFSSIMGLFLYLLYREEEWSQAAKIMLGGTLISALLVVAHNSMLSKFIHLVSFAGLVGFVQQRELRFLWYACLLGFVGIFETPLKLQKYLKVAQTYSVNVNRGLRFLKIGIIPILVIGIFYILYYFANPNFANFSNDFWGKFLWLWKLDLSPMRVLFTISSVFICAGILFPSQIKSFLFAEQSKTENLKRQRPAFGDVKIAFSIIGLKNEYRAGLFLIFALNVLLLIVNLTDIFYVWFGFEESTPQNLKTYVHEGTYLLITAILLAMSVLLFFFRQNLNFYPKRKYLLLGAYIWIFQNALLAISVGIRNYHYIDFHGLAYKRIGVFLFLTLTLYGLWTLYQKIRDHKTLYFLISRNAWALYAILLSCSSVNWDIMITKYNLNSPTKGAIDMVFMLRGMSDKNLFLLKQNEARLKTFDTYPDIDQIEIQRLLMWKEGHFRQRTKNHSWPSWNFADHRNSKYREQFAPKE